MSRGQDRILWYIGAFFLLAVGMLAMRLWGGGAASPEDAAMVGEPAPVFSLPIVAGEGADDGERVSLEALRGEVVVLDFWASWCRPCQYSVPVMNRVHERYGDRAHVYGLNVEESASLGVVREGYRQFQMGFPSLRDEGGVAQSGYAVTSIPTVVIVGRDGAVHWVHRGVPDEDELAEQIEGALTRD